MRYIVLFALALANLASADTIANYMSIANNIPQMEMKADPQSQAWARSAHHVITITCESIAETIIQANEAAKKAGSPLFCLPEGVQLNSVMLNELIQKTYKELASQQSDKDKMTISEIAWLGVNKQYPCQQNQAPQVLQQYQQ